MAKRILVSKKDGRILQFQDTSLFNYADPRPDKEIVDENGQVIDFVPGHEIIEISDDDWDALVKVDEVDDEVQGVKVKRYVIRPKLDIKREGVFVDKKLGMVYRELQGKKKSFLKLKKFRVIEGRVIQVKKGMNKVVGI